MGRLRTGIGLVGLAIACTLGTMLALTAALTVLTGWERVVLVSGSMAPLLTEGDVVFADPDVTHPLAPGTVVVVRDPTGPGLLTHRVVGTTPDGAYLTRGDANLVADSTPVPPGAVVGTGRVLVPSIGLPAAYARTGRPALAGGLVLLVGVLAATSRWAWPAEHRTRERRWRRGTALGVGAALALAGTGLTVPDHLSNAAFVRSTVNTGNSLRLPIRLYLKTSGAGNVASSVTLPLSITAPTVTTLPNYDTNRNAAAGLTITKGGDFSTSDATKIQRWVSADDDLGVPLGSSTTVRLWSAMKDFDTTKAAEVHLRGYNCNKNLNGCQPVGSEAVVTRSQWSPTGTWTAYDFDLGNIGTIPVNRRLELRLYVAATSADDVMFAYDTTGYPAVLVG